MTYAPADLLAVRSYLIGTLDLAPGTARGVDLEANEVGIVGDPIHAASGGYHEGNDDLSRVGRLTSDYSKRESARDRPGSNAASALDIGQFDATLPSGRRVTLRSLSLALAAACAAGDPRARDIREVIYTPDGVAVRRWDRLGVRASGDSSHLYHTHVGFHRDAEGRRAGGDNVLGLFRALIEGESTVAFLDDKDARILAYRAHCDAADVPTVTTFVGEVVTHQGVTVRRALVADVAAVRATVDALAARPTPPVVMSPADRAAIVADLAAALGTIAQDAAAAAVRGVLGALDGAVPPAGS